MRLRLVVFLVALAASLPVAAADLYADVNRLRTGSGDCTGARNLPPLKPRPALERAARDLARGVALEQGLKEAGYRATRSRSLSVQGAGVGAQAAAILSRPAYCPYFQEAGMADIGIYLDARQLWIVIAAPFAPSVGMSAPAALQRVLDLANRARGTARRCGERAFAAAPPLRWNDALAGAARLHAEDMARNDYLSHTGRDGSDPAQRVERAGYPYQATGENIAGGVNLTPENAMAGWLKSPGHCANLMNPAYTEMGAAFAINAQSELGVYWAQAFGAPR
jgi:uncharacterized protein YkwD